LLKFELFNLNTVSLFAATGAITVSRTVAGQSRAAHHLRSRVTDIFHTGATDSAGVETDWILGSAWLLVKFIGLSQWGEDRHIQVPRIARPLSPDAVIFIFATSVWVDKQRKFSTVLNKPRNDLVVVRHGNKCTPFAHRERSTFQSFIDRMIISETELAVVISSGRVKLGASAHMI